MDKQGRIEYQLVNLNQIECKLKLNNGRYTVGGGDDAVYFENATAGHLSMTYADGYLTLLAAKDTVWVDGELVDYFPFDVYPSEVISLGEEIHFAILGDGQEVPLLPELAPKEAAKPIFGNVSADMLKKHLRYLALGGVLAVGGIIGVTVLNLNATSAPVVTAQTVQAAASATITDPQFVAFVKELAGERFIRLERSPTQIELVVEKGANVALLEDDIGGVAKRLSTPLKVVIVEEDIRAIAQKAHADLTKLAGNGGLTIDVDGRSLTVKGTVLAARASGVEAKVAELAKTYDWLSIKSEMKVYNHGIKLVSVSISAKGAVATLKRGGEWAQVSEGGMLEGVGAIKSVRNNSVTIGTQYGDVVISL